MGVIRLLLVDDNPMIRLSLSLYMSTCEGIVVVGEGSDGYEAISLAKDLQPDVILMDLMMPNLDGVQATAHISQYFPHICVLVLTSGTDYSQIQAAQAAGAVGYLLKTVQGADIVNTIHKLCQSVHT
jgi:two-component system, NarL family, vancomycin resistance associated response regulator VraR